MKKLVAALLVAGSTGLASNAFALGPVGLEVGARVGTGTNPTGGAINPLGFGLGGRAGVTILGLYGGVSVIDYLGGSSGPISEHALLYGLEAGFGFDILFLKLRPTLGVGNANLTVSGGGFDASASQLYVEPGLTALITAGSVYFGVDANYLVITSGVGGAVTLHAQVGLTF